MILDSAPELPPPAAFPSSSPAPPECNVLSRQDSSAPLLSHDRAEAGYGYGDAERVGARDEVEEESEQQAEARVRKELPPIKYLRAWTYPLKGIYYLLRHPVLWKPMRRRLPLALIISTTIITLMFVLTFLPQAAFLALFKIHGPLALFHAALAVLTESATLISFILENFVIEEGVVDIFDATLLLKREDGLVSRGRELKPLATEENGVVVQGAKDVVDRLGEYTMSPFTRFSFCDLFVWVLELPINFVPLAGPWLFLALQGLSVGPAAHYHYTLLLGLKKKEQGVYFKHHRLEYMGYGAVGLLLQTFPIVSTFVCFTNAIGAALWAVQVERVKRGEGVDRHIERDS